MKNIEKRPDGNIRVWTIESGEEIHDVDNLDADIELVQEFSRSRFARKHTEDLRHIQTVEYIRKMNETNVPDPNAIDPDDI